MPRLIGQPTVIPSVGSRPKRIQEFAGRVNSGHENVSVAWMVSPEGWTEPGQRPALVVPRPVAKDPDGGVFLLRPDALEDLETGPFGLDFDTYDSIASGDIDGDGILDLAIGSTGLALVDDPSVTFVGGVAVWLGQADGSFKPWPGGLIQ